METEKTDYLVIGAGISGLTVARELHDAGKQVLVVEKGRGFGGRMATRRHGKARFDHGAQYFTVRTPRFQKLVDRCLEAGVIKTWFHKMPQDTAPAGHPRYVGINGISDLGKYLAEGLDVRRGQRVENLSFLGGVWQLETDVDTRYEAKHLVVSAPAPQALKLLETAQIVYADDATLEAFASIAYAKGLAVMCVLDGPSGLPDFGGMKTDNAPLAWLADNQMKGISPEVPAVTLHSTPEFAAEHWDSPDEVRGPALIAAAKPFLKSGVSEYICHRWGCTLPLTSYPADFWASPQVPLVFAGDSFGGQRVEGAVTSGFAAADYLLGR